VRFSNTELMTMAIGAGDKARFLSPPNPWVGALVVSERGVVVSEGHTQVPGESHAEIEAFDAPVTARGARPWSSPWSPARTKGERVPASRRSSRPGCHESSSARSTRILASRARAWNS